MGKAEIKRACALFTTMVVLFTLINNNPQNDHHIKQTIHKDAQLPNGTSVRHPEMVEARNSLWEHETSTIVLAQPQTRMEYTHFETSETFEPFTGKRKISLPTFHLVSPFAPNASSTADQQIGRQRRNVHEDRGHGRNTERQHPRSKSKSVLRFIDRMFQRTRHVQERRDAASRPRTRTSTQARHYPPQERSRRGGLVGREPGNDMLVGWRDLHPLMQHRKQQHSPHTTKLPLIHAHAFTPPDSACVKPTGHQPRA